jgi:hypothetical protein
LTSITFLFSALTIDLSVYIILGYTGRRPGDVGQAVKRVQDVEDGLPAMEKVELIKQFEKNMATAMYISC